MENLTKTEAERKVQEFFKDLQGKKPEEIKKIKRLAMHYNIKLRGLRKKFCKKCYSVFNTKNSEVGIKRGNKIVKCKNCGYASRWKINQKL